MTANYALGARRLGQFFLKGEETTARILEKVSEDLRRSKGSILYQVHPIAPFFTFPGAPHLPPTEL